MDERRVRKNTSVGIILSIVLIVSAGCSMPPFKITELRKNESSGYYDAVVRTEYLREYRGSPIAEFEVSTWGRRLALEDLTFTNTVNNPDTLERGDTFIVPLVKPEWKIYVSDKEDFVWSQDFHEMVPREDQLDITHSEAMKVARSIKSTRDEGKLKALSHSSSANSSQSGQAFSKLMPSFLPDVWELAEEGSRSSRYEKWREDILVEVVSVDYRELTAREREIKATGKTIDYLMEYMMAYMDSPLSPSDYGHTEVNGQPAVYKAERNMSPLETATAGSGARYSLAYFDNDYFVYVDLWSSPYEWTLPTGQRFSASKLPQNMPDDFELLYLWGPERVMQESINIHADGSGVYHRWEKTEKEQEFKLSQEEMQQLYSCLRENHFPAFTGEYIYSEWFGTELIGSSNIKLKVADEVYEGKYLMFSHKRYLEIRKGIHAIVMPHLGVGEEEIKAFEKAIKSLEERQRSLKEMFRPGD